MVYRYGSQRWRGNVRTSHSGAAIRYWSVGTSPLFVESLPDEATLSALHALNGISGSGPVKFRILYEAGIEPRKALEQSELLPFPDRTGAKLKDAVRQLRRRPTPDVAKRSRTDAAGERFLGL